MPKACSLWLMTLEKNKTCLSLTLPWLWERLHTTHIVLETYFSRVKWNTPDPIHKISQRAYAVQLNRRFPSKCQFIYMWIKLISIWIALHWGLALKGNSEVDYYSDLHFQMVDEAQLGKLNFLAKHLQQSSMGSLELML